MKNYASRHAWATLSTLASRCRAPRLHDPNKA